MSEANPRLSIVVTSHTVGRLTDIQKLLASIQGQTCPQVETVFVADDSPELATRIEEYAASISLPVRVLLHRGETGVNFCRNAGIMASQGEVVGLVDDDVILFPDWGEEMLRSYSLDPGVIGVTGPAFPLWEDEAMAWFPKEFWWMWGCTVWDWDQVREIRNVGGMNCSFRREALLEAGLYDPRLGPKGGDERATWFYPSGEEVELSLRMRRRLPGASLIYNPRVQVYHKVYRSRFTWRFMAKRAFRFGYTKAHVEALFKDSFRNRPVLDLERNHLRHLLLRMPFSLARELPRSPRSTGRKLAVGLIGTLFTGLGYLAYFAKPYKEDERTAG
jgi:glycosyltransferase involved in cell wall biosynthesis